MTAEPTPDQARATKLERVSALTVAAFVLSTAAVFVPGLCLVALPLAALALRSRRPHQAGKGLGVTAVVLSCVGAVVTLAAVTVGLLFGLVVMRLTPHETPAQHRLEPALTAALATGPAGFSALRATDAGCADPRRACTLQVERFFTGSPSLTRAQACAALAVWATRLPGHAGVTVADCVKATDGYLASGAGVPGDPAAGTSEVFLGDNPAGADQFWPRGWELTVTLSHP